MTNALIVSRCVYYIQSINMSEIYIKTIKFKVYTFVYVSFLLYLNKFFNKMFEQKCKIFIKVSKMFTIIATRSAKDSYII